MANKQKKKILIWVKAILLAFIIVLLIRIFVFQSYIVHDSNMCANVLPGEFVIVNKLAYGARIPITPLAIPFISDRQYESDGKLFLSFIQLPYWRIPGYNLINHSDVLLFNFPLDSMAPIDKKTMLLSRCIGLPGDTLRIVENKVYVNKKELKTENKQQAYYLIFKKTPDEKSFFKKYNIKEGGRKSGKNEFVLLLTELQLELIKKENELIKVEHWIEKSNEKISFVNDSSFNWNQCNIGPLVVPKRGVIKNISIKNIEVYRSVIENYEENKLAISNEKIFINDIECTSYTFKQNYYFVMDDNRDNARDSRFWGFLPESHIVGKASVILFSFDSDAGFFSKIRFSRMFNKVQ